MVNSAHEEHQAPAGRLTSVDNALLLLQLTAERQVLRVSEAADLLGVARSTAHRLLSALRRRDFLVQDRPNGAYRPGPALHAIGLSAIARLDVRRVAQPHLDQLRNKTRETVSLAVLEGTMVRFVECCEGLSTVRVGTRAGVVRHAHASAVGKAILAALPEAELAGRYPDQDLPAPTPAAIASRPALLKELSQVRRQGYALNWEESSEGVAAVAVAIRDATGMPLASISVAVPAMRLGGIAGLRALVPDVLAAAKLIHDQLHGAA